MSCDTSLHVRAVNEKKVTCAVYCSQVWNMLKKLETVSIEPFKDWVFAVIRPNELLVLSKENASE